jgi:VWFA-related protein
MGYFSYEGIKMLDSPTRDGNALLASIERNKNALRAPPPGQGAYGAFDRRQMALQGLGQVVNTVSARPGRKLVIWISPGWPLLIGPHVELSAKDRQWIFDAVVALSRGLRQAGVSIYQVDPLGPADVSGGQESYTISGAAQSSYSIAGGAQTSYALGFVKGVRTPKQVANAHLSLQVLAVQNGGQVLNANNDIAGEIAMCVADATAYYSIAFDSPAGDGLNDYHTLEVKLAKPGLTARTRTGYYALPGR